jgi:hypothetical protein
MSESLRPDSFQALLARLGPDEAAAGVRYGQIHGRLVAIFQRRGCDKADQLADRTLDTAARRIRDMGTGFDGPDAERYILGVAWNVARESFREPLPVPLSPRHEQRQELSAPSDRDEVMLSCLDRCLAGLEAADRDLCLAYHRSEGMGRIEHRARLAADRGVSLNALRLRLHRLTSRLRECVVTCQKQAEAGASDAQA